MDDGENSPGGVLSRDKRHWVDPYLFGGKTGQSVDFAARNGADLCEAQPDLKSRRL